jgi:hypothetical protein
MNGIPRIIETVATLGYGLKPLASTSLQKTACCLLDHDGPVVWQGKVDSEPGPLIEKLRLWHDQIDVEGLDACPSPEWLHRHLVAAGFASARP